jgi:superfamily II DNA or RNA helicase
MAGRWLIQLETGTGKTALCFAVACKYVDIGFKVLVLNVSEELTFRDYKKALPT